MCSCRLVEPVSVRKSPVRLEDFYPLLEMDGSTDERDLEDDDIYGQLEQKEKDLVLAAELGKALLEKNEELTRIHEQTVEEYNIKIEELEQERYHLKLRLDNVSGEYDNTVRELQWDITHLQQQMQERVQLSQESEKDRCQIIRELTQQNERLTEQLRKVSTCMQDEELDLLLVNMSMHLTGTTLSEEELTGQVQSLRDQLSSRRTSMHDHIHQLEVLQDEINLLTGRTQELERRLAVVTEERDSLACSLEECQDRILMLGKQNHEQENQIRLKGRDIEELRATNAQLEDQVENISNRLAPVDFNQSQNLFSELSQLSDSPDVDMGSKSPLPHALFETDWMNEEEIECDDSFTMATMSNSSHESEFMNFNNSPSAEHELRKELLEAYRQLQELCRNLKSRETGESEEREEVHMVQAGQLMVVIRQLREIIQSSFNQNNETGGPLVEEMKTKMGELQTAYSSSQKEVVKLTTEVQMKDEDLKQRTNQLEEFLADLRVHQDSYSSLQAERDRLQDSLLGELDAEDVLNQTRAERMAMKQRNKLEDNLASVKMDVLSLNSQLMEAIQQKVELSQKLDQWEVDMHEVLGLQMQKRIEEDTVREKAVAELELTKQDPTSKPKKSFFAFSRH
ncbi:LOW QUALITY PROTEIN: bicaudal D-related protein homolog [Liolophura sinensis]|uniref:LOW QUALITY PROTEIN: bicaudal D-related protein homolog n=1 Tax=Liolophura sinensis TaxID=3198878 RepID=UPI0031585925